LERHEVNCLNSIEAGYRGELRDLFEAHFGRFEEKLERRLAETAGQVARLEEKLERRLAETRAELVKWMFFFWTPVVLALIGLYFKG
jgi:hypothetical protein